MPVAGAGEPGGRQESKSEAEPAIAEFPVVGVGASAGGLDGFTQLLKSLPPDSGMAFVLIQHLDPTHSSFLRDALAKATAMRVIQPADGALVEPNHVYVIPPESDISIEHGRIVLTLRALENRGPHLSIDYFFRSLAVERGRHAIGVILSGNASDGTEGLRAIKAANGITFAQDPSSTKYPEMPRNALNAGVVDYSLAIPELAEELVRLSRHPYVAASGEGPPLDDAAVVAEILSLVLEAVGVDFTEYKGPTLERRLARRMALRRADGPRPYLAILKREPEEVRALYEDILIHVTSFFRDREVFEALEKKILPAILKEKSPEASIRVWVAGCSTGEEVYSIAISLLELLEGSARPVQIFGSDLSEAIIAKARAGIYPESALRDMSEERRGRYFVKTERGYRINKMVRDLCVFVRHNLGRDPPFSKLDLVSCRNVLIYFDQALQKRLIPTLHYALNQPGYLVLGRTESISGFSQLFSVVDKVNKIFARTATPSLLRIAARFDAPPTERQVRTREPALPAIQSPDVAKHLDRMLMARYSPPGVLINEKMDILQFRGETGAFLQPAPGNPQSNIINMARPGLLAELRAALAEAKKEMVPVRRTEVAVDQDGTTRICDLVVFPFSGMPDSQEPLYVVVFEPPVAPAAGGAATPSRRRRQSDVPLDDRRVVRLEHELAATKQYLQSVVDEHGRINDDLGAANEELISGNEELQSMNEELETAKEELQSTNEELTTVNDELHNLNEELTQTNSDLLNLLVTVDVPIIILDLELRIRRFTPKARSILNVLPSDIGRHVNDIKPNIDVADLERQLAEVIATGMIKESEVQDRQGRWQRMQIRPYATAENKVDGVIISLVDIDALKHHISTAQQARAEAERANRAKDGFLAVLGHELRTPLTSLLLHAQVLRRTAVTDGPKLKRVGESIERAARMQLQLIDDLLDVSRIVAGKMNVELRAVDLREVIKAAVEMETFNVQRKGIHLDVQLDEAGGLVSGDPVRLQQVVSNLLTNAIKFTPKGGDVTVILQNRDGHARLQVRDTGAGIEPAFLPQVFNRFAQEDTSNTRRHGGLGLGLAIVRHLVERHGGAVQAESPGTGLGATFSVTLPLIKASANVAQKAVVLPVEPQGPNEDENHQRQIRELRILLVDDDLATREAVSEMLSEMGADVRVAQSAAEAMTAVDEFQPKVLVCDIAMPEEDGYAFIRRLRARGGKTPALALTALATEEDRRRSLAAGFQMHMSKPVDMPSLTRAVVQLAEPLAVAQ